MMLAPLKHITYLERGLAKLSVICDMITVHCTWDCHCLEILLPPLIVNRIVGLMPQCLMEVLIDSLGDGHWGVISLWLKHMAVCLIMV